MLQQRMNTGFMDGCYDASASGHVEPNENIIQAAIRESKEEIGVKIAEKDLKLMRILQMNIDMPYIACMYICKKWTGEIVNCEPDKIAELSWYTKTTMPKNLTRGLSALRASDFSEQLAFEYIDEARMNEIILHA